MVLSIGSPTPVVEATIARSGSLWTVTPGAASEIQQAIDAARDNGGGRVRLPAAEYLLTSRIRLHSNVTVYGDGIDRTVLRWATANAPDHMMSNGSTGNGNTNIQLWGLTLDGQGKTKAGDESCCFGLRLNNVRNSYVVNVAVDRHSLDGVYLGYVHGDGVVYGAVNVRLSGCRANGNARNGISLIHGDANVIDGCTVNGNNHGEAVAGIDLEPDEGLSVTNSRIVGNTANNQNVGIQIFLPYNGFATTYRNAVCYNTTTGNVSAGIYSHRGDQNIFVGNSTSGNGTDYLVDDSSLEGPAYAGYCTLGSLPPHPSTLDVPTPTPTPRPSCTPRPRVSVTTQRGAPGTLQITIVATRSVAAPNNTVRQIVFGAAQNATVEIDGLSRPGGSFTATMPAGVQQVTFVVHRSPANAPSTTVPFTVIDDCGGWPSFVGGGGNAF
jgi:parallel beta-helix repeat protein